VITVLMFLYVIQVMAVHVVLFADDIGEKIIKSKTMYWVCLIPFTWIYYLARSVINRVKNLKQ